MLHAFNASKTASTWPVTLTFSNTAEIFPLGSITYVVLTTPMYLRPYMLFSCHTPYAVTISFDSSLTNENGNSYFVLNFPCDFTESGLTPRITAPAFLYLAKLSRKSHASAVQPLVSSLG